MSEEEILLELHQRNGWEYNHKKTLEELLELSEKLIKRLTKTGGPKEPSEREIHDEIGDVKLRIKILEYEYDPKAIQTRCEEKLAKWEDYIKTNKFKHI